LIPKNDKKLNAQTWFTGFIDGIRSQHFFPGTVVTLIGFSGKPPGVQSFFPGMFPSRLPGKYFQFDKFYWEEVL